MVEQAEAGLVQTDLSCDGCGYNLRTLQLDSVCPECSHTVAASLEASKERGNRSAPSEQSQRRLLTVGFAFCAYVLIAYCNGWRGVILDPLGASRLASLSVLVAGQAAMVVCYFHMTRRLFGMSPMALLVSWLSRITMVCAIGFAMFCAIDGWRRPPAGYPVDRQSLFMLLNALATTCGWIWLAMLATWMRRQWLTVVCIILCFASAPLVYTGLAEMRVIYSIWPTSLKMVADPPMVGPLWHMRWSFYPNGRLNLELLPQFLSLALNTITLLLFGIIFLRQGLSQDGRHFK